MFPHDARVSARGAPRCIATPTRSFIWLAALLIAASCANFGFAQERLWLREFGTQGYDDGTAIAAHSKGIYVVGRVQGALPGQVAGGITDGFVRRYGPAGGQVWTRQFSFNPNGTSPFAVAVDDAGVYVAGASSCRAGEVTDQCYAFARMYDHTGRAIWTHFSSRDGRPAPMLEAWGIAVDGSGVYVAGNGIENGNNTAVVTRLDKRGNEVWSVTVARPFSHPFGYIESATASGIAVDSTGIYVAGTLGIADVLRLDFDGNVTKRYGTGTIEGTIVEGLALDSSGIYVAGIPCPPQCQFAAVVRKYARNGAELWTRESRDAVGNGDLVVDATGVYLTGVLARRFPEGAYNAYVRRYGKNGALSWTHELAGASSSAGDGLAAYAGSLYVTGAAYGSLARQTSAGLSDAFLAKLEEGTRRQIRIDIFPRAIDPSSDGVIRVAILTTPTFNAPNVDPPSVRFGPGRALEVHSAAHLVDVDDDGDNDVLLHFATRDTGIACGDTDATLTAVTFAGISIEGSDEFVTVGCP